MVWEVRKEEEKKETREKNGAAVLAAVLVIVLLAAVAPAEAQSDGYALFDKLSFKVEGSWISMNTQIRLDSSVLGEGTTLNFEDLGLKGTKVNPTLDFEWRIARHHLLTVRWQKIDRSGSEQILEDIQWGDLIIPVDAEITLSHDVSQAFINYAYFPWVKERWAAGFGIGFRWMDVTTNLTWEGENTEGEQSTGYGVSAPLPYFNFEYRRLFSEHWRFKVGLGYLFLKVDDFDGGQWNVRVEAEYLIGRRWAVGAGLNGARIFGDWGGVENDAGESLLTVAWDMDINDVSIFARVRF
jgi:hypothetical protein